MASNNQWPTKGMDMDIALLKEGESCIEKWPRLLEDKDFAAVFGKKKINEMETDIMLRYVIIFYSHDSYLRKQIPKPSLRERKVQAAKLAGFRLMDNGKFTKNVEAKLLTMGDPAIVKAIVAFLKMQDSTGVLAMLTSIEENFWANIAHIMMAPDTSDDDKKLVETQEKKAKLIANNEKMLSQIEFYTNKMYNNDREVRSEIETAMEDFKKEVVVDDIFVPVKQLND